MRILRFLPAALVGLLLAAGAINAEQIKLADGRYLQGDVVEVKEDGFVFKITDTGGKVFLRWNQVDEGLEKRLMNKQEPDEGLDLEVMVPGARLELIDGTVYEGNITETAAGYEVVNLDNPRGRAIPRNEVIEEGYITDIMINADVVMEGKQVIELAEEQRAPVETARQYYELARIADRLALYINAKEYVALALAADPDDSLQARLSEYETQLDELIRQQAVLDMLSEARRYARKKQFQLALNILDESETTLKPTGPVLDKLKETRVEIDLDFTEWVIDAWYKEMRPVSRTKAREDDITVVEALNWARREMDMEIQNALAEEVGSDDPADLRRRFDTRFDLDDAGVVKLRTRRTSFGKDGFYQVVGGHLPVAGKKPQPEGANNDARGPGRRAPGGGRNRDGVPDNDDGFQFQDDEGGGIELPDGISPDDVRDMLRRALGRDGDEGDSGRDARGPGKQDISHLEVPNVVPSLTEWWDGASSSTRSKWLTAAYVKFGGTMRVTEYDDWTIKFE